MNLTSSQKVIAVVSGILILAGSIIANTVVVYSYVQRSEQAYQTSVANRQMILLLAKANRYEIGNPRRDGFIDAIEKIDARQRFGGAP